MGLFDSLKSKVNTKSSGKYTVLVVDNEADTLEFLKSLLESEGYSVITAISADDAWVKLKENNIDLVLLDIMMPGMPAQELVEKISSNEKLKGTKVIYVSAMLRSEYQHGSSENETVVVDPTTFRISSIDKDKVFDYIEKPFSNELLLKKIQTALKK